MKRILFYILSIVLILGAITALNDSLTIEENLYGFILILIGSFVVFFDKEDIKNWIGYNNTKGLDNSNPL